MLAQGLFYGVEGRLTRGQEIRLEEVADGRAAFEEGVEAEIPNDQRGEQDRQEKDENDLSFCEYRLAG